MNKVWLSLILVILGFYSTKAQSLSRTDHQEIRDQAESLVKEFENVLNQISSDNISKIDIETIIEGTYSGTRRIFDDASNSITDDIDPSYYSKNQERLIDIKKYLEDFDQRYQKQGTSTVTFYDIEVGNVRTNNGVIYVKVYYTSFFSGSSKVAYGNYKPSHKVAEVRAEKYGSQWRTHIVSIHFMGTNETKDITKPSEDYYNDNDGDGVINGIDECDHEKGPASNKGCPLPDYDKDGVPDDIDRCKYSKGPSWNYGCPVDSDGDGVIDDLDKCKSVSGPVSNSGCPYPDSDNDGTPDREDKCVNEYGPKNNQGCPISLGKTKTTTRVYREDETRSRKDENGKRRVKMAITGIVASPVMSYISANDSSRLRFDDKFGVFPGGGLMFFVHSERKVLNFSFGGRYVQKGIGTVSGEGSSVYNTLVFRDIRYSVLEVPFCFYLNSRGKSAFASMIGMSFNYMLQDIKYQDPIALGRRYDNTLVSKFNAGFRVGLGYIGNFKTKAGIHFMVCYSNEVFPTINTDFEYWDMTHYIKPFRNEKYRLGYLSLELTLRLW